MTTAQPDRPSPVTDESPQPPAEARAYSGRHHSDPDPRDPGFCRCGLGLDAWVHTDSTHYYEIPLAEWRRHG